MNSTDYAKQNDSAFGLLFGALTGEFISTAVGQGAAMAVDTAEFVGEFRTVRAQDRTNGMRCVY